MIDGKLFVTRQVAPEVLDLLRREFAAVDVWEGPLPPAPQELRERAQGCVALITMLTDRVDAELLEAAPGLKVVANVATGYDNFDLAAASSRACAWPIPRASWRRPPRTWPLPSCWPGPAGWWRPPRRPRPGRGGRGTPGIGWGGTSTSGPWASWGWDA